MIPRDISERELIDRGLFAQAALADPAVLAALDDLSNYHTLAMISSPIEAKETRDFHHHRIHALKDLVDTLRGYVQVKDQIIEQRDLEKDYE